MEGLSINPVVPYFPSRTATPENIEEITARGKALWASIYQPHAQKLHDKLGSYHPDFIGQYALTTSLIAAAFPNLVWAALTFGALLV